MKHSAKEFKIIGKMGEAIDTITVNIPRSYFLELENELNKILLFNDIKPMFNFLGYNQQEVAEVLDVNPSTLSRWSKNVKNTPIGKLRSKTIIDIDHIIAKGIRIFGTEENFKNWLNTPNYALGDVKPIELLKDPYHIELVDNAIEAMSWGNFI